MKRCSNKSCLKLLDEKCFSKDLNAKDGLKSWCKTCANDHHTKYVKSHRSKIRELDKRYKAKPNSAYQLRNPAYSNWIAMKSRCCNPNQNAFKYYGGRGITVCQAWLHSFDQFIADMGPKPSKQYSVDRIDPDGNYEPSNCRWLLTSDNRRMSRKRNSIKEVVS